MLADWSGGDGDSDQLFFTRAYIDAAKRVMTFALRPPRPRLPSVSFANDPLTIATLPCVTNTSPGAFLTFWISSFRLQR